MTPFFSIIIPVYNVEKYISDCFSSIIKQNFNDYEIIFVNDGSSDSSGLICKDICEQYENAKIINKENGGLSDARNVGMKNAIGNYIVLVDSDDMLAPNALKCLHDLIINEKNPEVIINRIKFISEDYRTSTDCNYLFSEAIKNKSISDSFREIINLDDYIPGAWSIVVKREYLIGKNLYFVKGLLHEDEQWTPRVILNARTIAFNNSIHYIYRQGRTGSITQVKSLKRELDKLWTVDSLYKESKSKEYSNDRAEALLERAIDLYWGVLLRSSQFSSQNNEYNVLLNDLLSKSPIFNLSENKKYKITRFIIGIIGIRLTSKLFGKVLEKKS